MCCSSSTSLVVDVYQLHSSHATSAHIPARIDDVAPLVLSPCSARRHLGTCSSVSFDRFEGTLCRYSHRFPSVSLFVLLIAGPTSSLHHIPASHAINRFQRRSVQSTSTPLFPVLYSSSPIFISARLVPDSLTFISALLRSTLISHSFIYDYVIYSSISSQATAMVVADFKVTDFRISYSLYC